MYMRRIVQKQSLSAYYIIYYTSRDNKQQGPLGYYGVQVYYISACVTELVDATNESILKLDPL